MGIDYEIQVCVPAGAVQRGIVTVAELSGESGATSTVHFATGQSVDVPFTSEFEPAHLQLLTGGKIRLDTTILFPITDAAVEDYAAFCDPSKRVVGEGGVTHLSVGYIYLEVGLGRDFALFSFQAAVTSMSRLFERSPSV